VFADTQGRIFTVKVGELSRDEAKVILDGLRDVDTGRTDITAARQRLATEMARIDAAKQSTESSAAASGLAPRS
jgi:hypothetical protein